MLKNKKWYVLLDENDNMEVFTIIKWNRKKLDW